MSVKNQSGRQLNSRTLNLKGASVLLVDHDPFSVKLISQMLRGFGLETEQIAETGDDARRSLEKKTFDLAIFESVLPDMHSNQLIKWLRHNEPNRNRFIPIMVVTGYTNLRNVTSARDSGAHSVLRKPISPQLLFDHIAWIARSNRPFIEVGEYFGPDRRFKTSEPPGGVWRRHTDHAPAASDEIAMVDS